MGAHTAELKALLAAAFLEEEKPRIRSQPLQMVSATGFGKKSKHAIGS